MVKRAVIIAAGAGKRLNGMDEYPSSNRVNNKPKPLTKVAGMPLLKRVILTAKRAGIREFIIVTGYQGQKIREEINKDPSLKVDIKWVHNPYWMRSNGLSVLAAERKVKGNFVLLMADHIFEPQILKRLLIKGRNGNESILCIDKRIGDIFDIDDATKVKTNDGFITDIGKDLSAYDAVDTGIFLFSRSIFDALKEAKTDGDCSLSDGVWTMAREGNIRTMDIGEAYWQDVDTPETLKHAENIIRETVTKSTDGFISRNFNRRVSFTITKLIADTRIKPNHITTANFLLGVLAALMITQHDYLWVILGALIFQLTSIVDGVDGELAKLKFKESRFGQWFDTVSDNIVYIAFFIGLFLGIYNRDPFPYPDPNLVISCVAIIVGIILSLSIMYTFLRKVGMGSLVSYAQALEKFISKKDSNPVIRAIHGFKPFVRRDFFAFLFCILALFNKLEWIVWGSVLAVNLMLFIVIFTSFGLSREFQLIEARKDYDM